MKKIIGIVIVFGFLLIKNTALAVPPNFSYVCPVCSGEKNSPCAKAEKECLLNKAKQEEQKKQLEQKRKEEEAIERGEKEKIYNERKEEIVFYSDFFKETGVNLTLDTSEEQYSQWLKELKQAEVDYIKEQENQQKIKELEERINILESKPVIIEKIITPTEIINTHNKEEVAKPIVNENKSVKPVIKKEEPKKEITKEEVLPKTEISTIPTEPTTNNSKTPILKKIIKWFKSWL